MSGLKLGNTCCKKSSKLGDKNPMKGKVPHNKGKKKLRIIWRWWAKSLGQKAIDNDNEADKVAIIRTLIFATYLVTNAFIIAGVVRHWNDNQINVEVEVYENSNYSEKLHSERRHNLGVDGNTRIEGISTSKRNLIE